MNTTDLEKKRKHIELAIKLGALGVFGFLVAPFVFTAVTGLIGAVVCALVGLTIVNAAPAVGALAANMRIKAIKAVAALDPIATLENQYKDRMEALEQMRENIKQSIAILNDLKAQIQEHDRQYPGHPSQFTDKYLQLRQLVDLRGHKYQDAQKALKAFSEMLDEKRTDWRISQTLNKAAKLADVGKDFQTKLMADTALTAIQDNLNYAFSELETSLLDAQGDQAAAAPAVAAPAKQAQIPVKTGAPVADLTFDVDAIMDVGDSPSSPVKKQKIRE